MACPKPLGKRIVDMRKWDSCPLEMACTLRGLQNGISVANFAALKHEVSGRNLTHRDNPHPPHWKSVYDSPRACVRTEDREQGSSVAMGDQKYLPVAKEGRIGSLWEGTDESAVVRRRPAKGWRRAPSPYITTLSRTRKGTCVPPDCTLDLQTTRGRHRGDAGARAVRGRS